MQNNVRHYCCPDWYVGQPIYNMIFKLQKTAPEIFYPNTVIKNIYGTVPNSTWNGGCAYFRGTTPDMRVIRDTIEFYGLNDITLQLTATNPMLVETDIYDRLGNMLLTIFNEYSNIEVLVASPILEHYIRENYPRLKIVKSIIATEQDENYNEALNKYSKIVLPRRHIKNDDVLVTINEINRGRVELLCNDPCPIDCPNLYDHYKEYGRTTLYEQSSFDVHNECIFHKKPIGANKTFQQDQIKVEDMDKYLSLGYNLFKIAGRGSKQSIVRAIVPYLIKPEYQVETACYLMS